MTILASASIPWFVDPSFWTGITFLVFASLIVKLTAAPLSQALRGRQKRIEEQLHQAEEARKVVRELKLKQEERHRQARIEAAHIVEEAKRDAERTRKELIQRASGETAKLQARAARDIELAKHKAIHDLADHATDRAVQLAEEALRTQITPEDDDRLIDAALAEMAQSAGRHL